MSEEKKKIDDLETSKKSSDKKSDKKSSEKKTSPALKRSWFQELKVEFKKISWPSRKDVSKQSIVVLVSAIVLGCLIALVDYIFTFGIHFIIG